MAGITDLRFLKRSALSKEHDLYKDYYRDLIHNYGIDVVYFRKDLSFYDVPSGLCNYAYGEDSTATYFLSSNMVVFGEMLGDSFLMNNFGIETDGDIAIYFTIDDFTRQFQDILGTPTTASISIPLFTTINNSTGNLSGTAFTTDLSASVSSYIDSTNVSGNISGELSLNAFEQAFVNYRIYVPNSYSPNRHIAGTLTGTYLGTIDASGNGTASGSVSGIINYFKPMTSNTAITKWKIAPQVGDFFRLDFENDNNEEYEISQIHDRDLQNSGISVLLGKYIWKCTCNRRDPSHETVLEGQGDQQEPQTTTKIEQNTWTKVSSDKIFDYDYQDIDLVDLKNSDEVYGSYDKPF